MRQQTSLGLRQLAIVATTLGLAACSGGVDVSGGLTPPVPSNPVTTSTTINRFDVTGTAATANGIVPINAAFNAGEFTMDWEVTSSNPYRVEVFISADNTLDKTSDIEIYNRNCGNDPLVYTCNNIGNYVCAFTNANEMSCGIVTAFNTRKDLTTFLNVIPKSAFMMIEACNALRDSCKTASVAIELQ